MRLLDDEIPMARSRNLKRVEKEYWIDTYGLIHKFKGDLDQDYVSLHCEIVSDLFPNELRPEKYVEDLGWIKVGSTVYSCPVAEKEPTQDQVNTLLDLGLLNRLEINRGGYYIKFLKRD